ncbi:hypothetical protein Tco_0045313 [Tanacetum coccineum]
MVTHFATNGIHTSRVTWEFEPRERHMHMTIELDYPLLETDEAIRYSKVTIDVSGESVEALQWGSLDKVAVDTDVHHIVIEAPLYQTISFKHDISDLSDGIRELKNEQQFADFLAVCLGNDGKNDLYVEHHGYDIHDWFPKDDDDLEDYDEDACELDDISAFVEPQFVGEEVIIPNRCTRDANALVEDEIEDQSVDPIYKVQPGVVYRDHDPEHPWKIWFPS